MLFVHCEKGGRDFWIEAAYEMGDNGLSEFDFYLKDWEERHSENPTSSEGLCLTAKERKFLQTLLLMVFQFSIVAPQVGSDVARMMLRLVKINWARTQS